LQKESKSLLFVNTFSIAFTNTRMASLITIRNLYTL